MFNINIRKSWISLSPLLISTLMAILIIVLSPILPPKLPLFYSLSWGDKQLANHYQLLIIPGTLALVTLFNLIFSWQLHPQQVFFKKILLISTILICLILVITFLKIIFIFI